MPLPLGQCPKVALLETSKGTKIYKRCGLCNTLMRLAWTNCPTLGCPFVSSVKERKFLLDLTAVDERDSQRSERVVYTYDYIIGVVDGTPLQPLWWTHPAMAPTVLEQDELGETIHTKRLMQRAVMPYFLDLLERACEKAETNVVVKTQSVSSLSLVNHL